MDFTIFGSCLIKKNWSIFVHFSTLMSTIYCNFIYVIDDNIASVVLFQNLGNLKTKTTKFFFWFGFIEDLRRFSGYRISAISRLGSGR